MPEQFFYADTHLGHKNIITFKRQDGTPLRAFPSVEEHDEHIIQETNKVVGANDKLYLLGDAVINRRCLPLLGRLNGKKRLIRGNHDIFRTSEYLPYFEEVLAYRVFNDTPKKFICSHIPIHPQELSRWSANVHGHLHSSRVMTIELSSIGAQKIPDTSYVCVSVEHTDYRPLSLEEVLARIV